MKINLPQLPAWPSLTDSERYHAGVMARQLQDTGAVKEWRPGCVNQLAFDYEHKGDMLPLFARDSLLCALTHAEPKYALRALLQAAGYIAKLETNYYLADAYHVAKNRVEGLVLS